MAAAFDATVEEAFLALPEDFRQVVTSSTSTVSRRFVQRTEVALAELMAADMSGLDLVALMVDGVHFAESCCVVALGIGADGTKHPLGVVEAPPRTPPWSPICSSASESGALTSPARCWS